MASNPYVNKVEFGGNTVMDLTNDTASPGDVLLGETFHDRSGAPQSGTLDPYQVNDTAETTIDDDDYFPFYDSSATAKRKSLWSNIKSVLKTYFDAFLAHKITRTGVTASAGSTVRIPAGSDTNSKIKTTSIVIPVCDDINGRGVKYKSCTAYNGYANIVLSEAISNKEIGVVVLNL